MATSLPKAVIVALINLYLGFAAALATHSHLENPLYQTVFQ